MLEKSALRDSLPPGKGSPDVDNAIDVLVRSEQKLQEDLVVARARRAIITESVGDCKQQLMKYSQVARKSTNVHIARAQSEQSNTSSVTTAAPSNKIRAKK